MDKKLEILVVEDKENHLADARAYFNDSNRTARMNVDYATTLKVARDWLAQKNYDGVISDIFFPSGLSNDENRKTIDDLYSKLQQYADTHDPMWRHEMAKAMNSWRNGGSEPPCGVLIAEDLKNNGVLVVLNTDTYHHGYSTEPVNKWARSAEIELVDAGQDWVNNAKTPYTDSSRQKDWRSAYARIVSELEGISHHNLDINRIQKDVNELKTALQKEPANDGLARTLKMMEEKMQRCNAIAQKYAI